jgi:hypothetical protein
VTVTVFGTPTGTVVIWKVALDVPPGTSTLGGIVATDGLLFVSVTVVPPLGAVALSVTVP